ncbi:MAG: hypothetical protein HKO56_09120 [Bacteroidia bacterium]|nr:hypothetical protein [Bacteroidia bacterium]NNC86045.1 hypothetical protein [Bacteroidia bacterium]NNM16806.1 hypothetical protein [Bacteroidia bacterium]
MIEITDQSVLYIGTAMYTIFMIATIIEFRNMKKRASKAKALKKKNSEGEKVVPIRNINVANYR